MSRAIDVSVQSPASAEQVYTAFSSQDYWLARFAALAADTTLDALVIDADGAVSVDTTVHLGPQLLPAPVANLVAGELAMLHSETWRPARHGRVRGRIDIRAPAALGSGSGEALLTPLGCGSILHFAATVQVKIPWVGGRIESHIGRQLAENIRAIQCFTTEWIVDHA